MATTPEQMQQWMAEMMRRQQMEQQWAAQQGAYSGQPGAPAMPVVAAQQPVQQTMEYRAPGAPAAPQTMEEAMRQRYAAAQQQYAQPDIWRPQTQPQPVPMPVGNEQMQYAGGTPGFYQQPGQRWGGVVGQQQPTTPEQQFALQQQAEEQWRQRQMQMPGAAAPAATGNEQLTTDNMRQQMEQKFMERQGAYTGQPGAPVPMPVMRGQGGMRGLQNAYSRGARGAGLINQMNAREQQPQDAYAGQNLTDEQRKVAQANEASIRAQQPAPATPAQPAVPTQKWAEEKYNAPAAGALAAKGDEMFTKMKTMYEQKQPQLPTV
jgi:hypothetical protein